MHACVRTQARTRARVWEVQELEERPKCLHSDYSLVARSSFQGQEGEILDTEVTLIASQNAAHNTPSTYLITLPTTLYSRL